MSTSTKRRHVKDLTEKLSIEPLPNVIKSVAKLVKKSGDSSLALIIKKALYGPAKAKHAAEEIRNGKVSRPYTSEEALAFLIDGDFSRLQYEVIYDGAWVRGYDVYPPYGQVQAAKQKYRPSPPAILTGDMSHVPLQALLDHTAQRIALLQNDVIVELLDEMTRLQPTSHLPRKCILQCSYGFDGVSAQAR